jgi:hypothetical protein
MGGFPMTQSRLETIREIAINTGKPFEEEMTIYTKIDSEIYLLNYNLGKPHELYNPVIEDEIAKLVEEECKR